MSNAFCVCTFSLLLVLASAVGAVEREQRGDLILEDIPRTPAQLVEKLEPYLATMEKTGIEPQHRQVQMAPDRKGVYAIAEQDGEFRQLRYLPLDGGQRGGRGADRLSAHLSWDVETFALSEDGRYLVFVTNEDGFSRLHLRDLRNGFDLPAPILPIGRILDLTFASDNTNVLMGMETTRSPREVWTYYVGSARLDPPAASEGASGLDTSRFVDPQLIRYPTFDGTNGGGGKSRQVPAFVYKPSGEGPFPVLILLDVPQPGVQQRPGFDPFTQFLVGELGIAVIKPNVRGAGGYGGTYAALDDGARREDAVKDIGSLIIWLGLQPPFDPERIAIMGMQYGGFLATAAMIHFGERLAGGIDLGGVKNFATLLRHAPEERQELLRREFGDERDPAMETYFRRISPFHQAVRIPKPMFFAQGTGDPGVPAFETEVMATTIRARGVPVWCLLAQNEPRGLSKPQSRRLFLQTAAAFLQQALFTSTRTSSNAGRSAATDAVSSSSAPAPGYPRRRADRQSRP